MKIAELICDDNYFFLNNRKENEQEMYISINNYYNQISEFENIGYKLNCGDIIRIGRFKFKVRGIHRIENSKKIKNATINVDSKQNVILNERVLNSESSRIDNLNINQGNICKICYSSNNDSPLISPCCCTGSLKYIHLNCLHEWLKSKVKIYYKNENNIKINAYKLEPVKCEICKEFYPDFIKLKSQLYEICNYCLIDENDLNSYNLISLETIESEKNTDKYVYNIYYKNNSENKEYKLKIGRGNNCEIRLNNEPSISREHCELMIVSNEVFIKDSNT